MKLEKILFWLHLPVVLTWFGLFLVPSFLWQGKITVHFWYVIIVLFVEFAWGLYMYKYTQKIDIVCPITTWMQKVRGYSLKSKKNYGHSYIAELCELFGVKANYTTVNIILLVSFIIVVVQYMFFR